MPSNEPILGLLKDSLSEVIVDVTDVFQVGLVKFSGVLCPGTYAALMETSRMA